MVAQNLVRKNGVKQAFRFVKGIWLHRKSRQSRFFPLIPILHHTCQHDLTLGIHRTPTRIIFQSLGKKVFF